jgi:hypothetical protein
MDADRFDRLTLAFAGDRSRRAILGSITAGLAGLASFAGLGSDIALEARRRKKKNKKKNKNRRKHKKNNKKNNNNNDDTKKKECSTNSDCPPPQVCNAGKGECGCPFQCCSDSDCRVDEFCANINNSFSCFPR